MKTINTSNYELSKVQDNVEAEFKRIFANYAILNGAYFNVFIPGGPVVIEHKLGRPYQGWIIVNTDAKTFIYVDASTPNPRPQDQLILSSSDPANVKVYIF